MRLAHHAINAIVNSASSNSVSYPNEYERAAGKRLARANAIICCEPSSCRRVPVSAIFERMTTFGEFLPDARYSSNVRYALAA